MTSSQPQFPVGLHAMNFSASTRVEVGPGCHRWDLPAANGISCWVVEIAAGAQWPYVDQHDENGEMFFVLSGELIEGNERYGAGSYVLFGPHSSHRPRSERGVRLFGFNVLARADDTRSCYAVKPVGVLRSSLKLPEDAPMQGDEGAPDAVLEIDAQFARAAQNIEIGEKIVIVTWLHLAQRDVYAVHPRSDSRLPLTGVFSTRSPDRPNPIGLHPVTVLDINENRLTIGPIEAVDGTPVIDIKPVIDDA